MTRRIRSVCTLAAVSIAAGMLASCAGGTSGSTAYEEGNLQATDRSGRRVRLTPRSAVYIAFRSWQRKNYGEAIKLANHAINSGRLKPRGLSLAYLVRGLAYHSTGRYAAAAADYTASVKSDPKNHLAYQSRGLVRGVQKDTLGAIDDLNTAIRIRPTFTSHYVRGLMNLRMKRFDNAYSDASTVITMRPKRYHGYYLRGLVRHFRGQRNLAAADYRHVLQINPAHKGAKAALRIVRRGQTNPRIAPRRNPNDVRLLPISATTAD